jgi:cytoskeleton protein RodZ
MTDNSYHPSQKEIHDLKGLSVGEILRRARMHYGLSLEEVTAVLRIREASLEALEADDVSKLPGRVYAIGYIRSYAEYLSLDGDQVVTLFKEQLGQSISRPEYNFPVAISESKRPDLTIFVISLLGLIIVFASYQMLKPNENSFDPLSVKPVSTITDSSANLASAEGADPTDSLGIPSPDKPVNARSNVWPPAVEDVMPEMLPSVTVDSAAPATELPKIDKKVDETVELTSNQDELSAIAAPITSTETTRAPSVTSNNQAIRIVAKDSTWLQIKDPEGTVVFTGILKQGRTIDIPADAIGWKMDTGNAGGLEIFIDDQKLPALGGNGIVVRRIPLLAEALRARAN